MRWTGNCCRCASGGLATPGGWQLPIEQQVDNFLDIACAEPRQSQGGAPEAGGSTHGASTSSCCAKRLCIEDWADALGVTGLLGRSFTVAVALPIGFFAVLTPLLFEETPFEVWFSYYWGTQYFVALWMAEKICSTLLGGSLHPASLICTWTAAEALAVVSIFIGEPSSTDCNCWFVVGSANAGLFLCLMAPPASRLFIGWLEKLPLAPAAFGNLGMFYGATPTALSVAMYIALSRLEGLEGGAMLLAATALWTCAPFAVKPLGNQIWSRSCPAKKFLGSPIWILYCDLAFGSLGLVLFSRTPTASLMYAASVVPVLALHVLRGLRVTLEDCGCACCSNGAELHIPRLQILLDAFVAVLSRAFAYTQLFCMAVLRHLTGTASRVLERPNLFRDGQRRNVFSLQIHREVEADAKYFLFSAMGLIMSCSAFAVFCYLLPALWAQSQRVSPVVDIEAAEETFAHQAGWVRGGDAAQTRQRQLSVLSKFLDDNSRLVLALSFFQFMITISAVNLAETILWLS